MKLVALNFVISFLYLLLGTTHAQDVVVHISGPGGTAKYIKEGESTQNPIAVIVGQTIRIKNDLGVTSSHSVTHTPPTGRPVLFNTGLIPPGNFKDLILTPEIFAGAGGVVGGTVNLDFHCLLHPNMKSSFLLQSPAVVVPGSEGPGTSGPLRIRKDVAKLSAAEIASLRHGVEVMRSRPASDKRSWRYWANIHYTTDIAADPLWNQCEHGTIQFFAWHRAYLYYFEQVLRDASGDPNLTLPYWNWTTQPSLPEIYRVPGDATNPLYEARRAFNDPSLSLPDAVVQDDLSNALNELRFFDIQSSSFSDIDNSPHGQIHVFVGGPGGVMSRIDTSANDPIFWAHHANIDRLWNVWIEQGAGRVNPSDPSFLNRTFTFVDASGANVAIKVADTLSTLRMGYRYDEDPVPTPPSTLLASTRVRSDVTSLVQNATASETRLGLDVVRLKLNSIQAEVTKQAIVSATAPGSSKLYLLLKDLSFVETPGHSYGVYIDLPESVTDPDQMRLHYVGSINFFRHESHRDDHGAKSTKFNQSMELTAAINRLRHAGIPVGENPTVTLRPITAKSTAEGAERLRELNEKSVKNANIQLGGVELRQLR